MEKIERFSCFCLFVCSPSKVILIYGIFVFQVYPQGQNAKDLKREPALDKPGPLGLKYK